MGMFYKTPNGNLINRNTVITVALKDQEWLRITYNRGDGPAVYDIKYNSPVAAQIAMREIELGE